MTLPAPQSFAAQNPRDVDVLVYARVTARTSPLVQGGMLMPISVGGRPRSPRAHAAAATQEISECWEVDWTRVKLLVIPLADGA